MRALIFGLALATACTGAEPATPGTPADASGPTPAKLEEARNSVGGMMPLDNARQKLVGMIGEPKEDTESEMRWIVPDGERCRILIVQKVGTMVGQVSLKTSRCPE